MNLMEILNTNKSVKGEELLEWINSSSSPNNGLESTVRSMLFHKYVANSKDKIKPGVYYYVNYNNWVSPEQHLAYIVRDRIRSPKLVSEELASTNIVGNGESYSGNTIAEWAYYHNDSSEKEFYIEGCDLVTTYLEGAHPIKSKVYYFVVRTSKGIRVFRDLNKSPRGAQ